MTISGNIKTIIVICLLIMIGCGVYKTYQSGRNAGYSEANAEFTKAKLLAEQQANEKMAQLYEQLEEAQNHAILRAKEIDSLSNDMASTTGRMQHTITTLRKQLSSDSCDAIRRKSDSILTVFGECQREYTKMGENADRHAVDVEMLKNAWPVVH